MTLETFPILKKKEELNSAIKRLQERLSEGSAAFIQEKSRLARSLEEADDDWADAKASLEGYEDLAP